MNRFRSFVRKEFFHIFRDWQTLVILIGMPIAQILLFGYAISNEIREAPFGVLDHDFTQSSRQIAGHIDASDYFVLYSSYSNREEISEAFKRGDIRIALIFPDGFERDMGRAGTAELQVLADASDPNTASLLSDYSEAISMQTLRLSPGFTESPLQIRTFSQLVYNPMLEGAYLFVPGTISVILMLISAMMTSISITREKELGTMEILLATPMQPIQIILGKVVPYMGLAFLNGLIILLFGFLVFGIPINGSLPLLLAEMFLFIVVSLALGIFISSITDSQQVALMISLMGLMLPTILLSGFIFPIENMPWILQVISNIVPAKWFLLIIKGIMLKGQGLEMFWMETLILLGFMLFFILLSVRKFKIRLA